MTRERNNTKAGDFMTRNKKTEWLKKYTSIEHLEDILTKNRLHLANPESWEDKNDIELIKHYRSKMGIKDIRILCMNESADRYHFWKIYGQERQGVCLWFEKLEFTNNLKKIEYPKTKYRCVSYYDPKNPQKIETDDLPFLKRVQYEDEQEFRIISQYDQPLEDEPEFIPFDRYSLKKIYINDWVKGAELDSITTMVKNLTVDYTHITDCKIQQNKTLGFDTWITAVLKATK